MGEFKIENIAVDRFNNGDDEIGSNVINVELAEKQLTFPMPVPHQSELKKANDVKIKLKSSMLQYVYRVEGSKRINTKATKDEIIEKIKNILEENPDLIIDVFFQFWKEIAPTEAECKKILEIQFEAGLLMIADYESNPNQSIEKFENQLKEVLKKYPKNTICPTLDMGMKPVELLEKKIQMLFDYGIKKFNVIYRHIIDEQDNWIALSKKIYGKDIWCNVVGIPQQYFTNSNKFSLISSVFFYGIHTASLQYPRFRKTKKKKIIQEPKIKIIYVFNPSTGYFEETDTLTDEEARAKSINLLVEYSLTIHQKISSKEYYSKFIPTQPALNKILNSRI